MMYIDYLLYIIIIGLFFVLMDRIIDNENVYEGFEHIGKSVVNVKKQPDNEMKTPGVDNALIAGTSATYSLAAESAKFTILFPYRFLRDIVKMTGDAANGALESGGGAFSPIVSTIKQLFDIFWDIFKSIFKFFIGMFKGGFGILRNLPAFFKKWGGKAVDGVKSGVNTLKETGGTVSDGISMVFDGLISVPGSMFDFFNSMFKLFVNIFIMAVKGPAKLADTMLEKTEM